MRTHWIVLLLVVMNGVLLASNWTLTRSRDRGWDPRKVNDIEAAFARESSRLAAERMHLTEKLSTLTQLIADLKGQAAGSGAPPEETPEGAELLTLLDQVGITEKPDPMKIPLMTEEEKARLEADWGVLPPLMDNLLLQDDVDLLLGDPLWNPERKNLSPEARAQVDRLLKDYAFFARVSLVQRFQRFIEPEVSRLREAGAYVEFEGRAKPASPSGEFISHMESAGPNRHRLYYFYPDDAPDLFRFKKVCEERGRETFVKIYQAIQGSSGD